MTDNKNNNPFNNGNITNNNFNNQFPDTNSQEIDFDLNSIPNNNAANQQQFNDWQSNQTTQSQTNINPNLQNMINRSTAPMAPQPIQSQPQEPQYNQQSQTAYTQSTTSQPIQQQQPTNQPYINTNYVNNSANYVNPTNNNYQPTTNANDSQPITRSTIQNNYQDPNNQYYNNQNQQQFVSNRPNGSLFSRFKWLILVGVVALGFLVGMPVYNNMQLGPINSSDKTLVPVTVKEGSTSADIGSTLKKLGLVRTATLFQNYATQKGETNLKAGDFYLSKSQSVSQMYDQLIKGSNQDAWNKQFIKGRAPYAQELQKKYGVLASINLAQTILESDWGQSKLSTKYNNYYGIKAQGSQKSVTLDTKEYLDGEWTTVKAKFAVYSDWKEGMLAHVKFLVNGTDLNSEQFVDVMAAKDYKTAAKALVQDGYATDPTYSTKLIKMIETYNLDQYDK